MSTAERLEELRILPRVSAEDRRRYGNMQSAAEIQLELYEPLHSRRERRLALRHGRSVVWLEPHNPESLHMHPLLWRKHWRSLPDYDGPPMRTPSGAILTRVDPVSRRPVKPGYRGPTRLDVPVHATNERVPEEEETTLPGSKCVLMTLRDWLTRALGAQQHRNLHALARETTEQSLYDRPAQNGRGWCPALAGVAT